MAENLGSMLADMKLQTANKVVMSNLNCVAGKTNQTEADEVLSKSKQGD
jgi:hypothetical protein